MREGISNVGAAVSLERAAQILKSAANVLIICHKHPDGDTLGSALALASVLTEIGSYIPALKLFMSRWPLASVGLGWLLPSLVAAAVGALVGAFVPRKHRSLHKQSV